MCGSEKMEKIRGDKESHKDLFSFQREKNGRLSCVLGVLLGCSYSDSGGEACGMQLGFHAPARVCSQL